MYKFLVLMLFLAIACTPYKSEAALFCLQIPGIAPQCDYADAAQCRKRASELQATCSVNRAEITLPQGIARFCSVDSNRVVQCIYSDRTGCDNEAARHDAVCVGLTR